MFQNYLIVAVRNIRRHKIYSIINIAGLAVGMACTILILLWVQYELSFDRYHENADRIYRLAANIEIGEMRGRYAVSSLPIGPTLQRDYPEVLRAVKLYPHDRKLLVQYKDKRFLEDGIIYTEDTIFDIFRFPLISGDPNTVLKTADSLVITEAMAEKYFGSENPIGKILNVEDKVTLKVTGVMQNVPLNSHVTFNMLLSWELLKEDSNYFLWEKQWIEHKFYTYLLLRSKQDAMQLEQKFPALIQAHMGEILEALGGRIEYFLQPLTGIHLHSDLGLEISGNGDIVRVYVFTVIGLIIATCIVLNQLNYVTHKSLGFDKERVLCLRARNSSIWQSFDAVKSDLKGHTGISDVTAASRLPGQFPQLQVLMPEATSFKQSQLFHYTSIDPDFIPAMGIEISAGRNFSAQFSSDIKEAILINEAAARQFRWDDPIGRKIAFIEDELITKTVVGVAKDFHLRSLHHRIQPLFLDYRPAWFQYVIVEIKPNRIPEVLQFLEKRWELLQPAFPFEYSFLDEAFDRQYRVENKLSQIFSYFTFLAILIAWLGLFGLASFTAEQRTKEIGIRKSVGASVSEIILLLSKEFTNWVLLANIIAWPLAYFAMNKWLQNFAYRIIIGLDTFIQAGVLAFVIALVTVCYQSIRAARANPVDALRYE